MPAYLKLKLYRCKRYFGGIKLGAGGLVRAYGGVARTCIRNAETLTHIPKVLVRLRAPLTMSGAVFQVGKIFKPCSLLASHRPSTIDPRCTAEKL